MVNQSALEQALATLRQAVGSARGGLPEEIFLFISSLTPMVNVDLLIRDATGRTLLTWRDDTFYGPGWHVPGGIIRFKETAAERIHAVARSELGAQLEFDPRPLALNQIFNPQRDVRGHFISMLHSCRLLTEPDAERQFDPARPRAGDWAWHARCPDQLIAVHQQIYRPYLEGELGTSLPGLAQVLSRMAEDA